MVFGLADGGRDLESFVLLNMNEARSLLLQVKITQKLWLFHIITHSFQRLIPMMRSFHEFQVASALAVGEVACEFEHRDLHWSAVDLSSAFGMSRLHDNFG